MRTSATLALAACSLTSISTAQVEVIETERFDPPTVSVIPGYFGSATDLVGDVLVSGDREDGFPAGNGRAFVYMREGNGWSAPTLLTASNGTLFDAFGAAAVTDGETVFVGAPIAEAPSGATGAVYTYTRQGTNWVEGPILQAADGNGSNQFGRSLAVDGDTLVVGSLDPTLGSVTNSVHVFERTAAGWSEVQEIIADADSPQFFGLNIDIDGDTLVVGAPGLGNTTIPTSPGEVSIYRRMATGWVLEAMPSNASLNLGDNFGLDVDLDGDNLIVGAMQGSSDGAGRAFSFRRVGTTWFEEGELVTASPQVGARYGSGVTLSGNVAIVTAPFSDMVVGFGGSASVFERSGGQWFEVSTFSPSDVAFGDQFGYDPLLHEGPGGLELLTGSGFASAPSPTGAFYAFRLRNTTLGERLCAGSNAALCPCANAGDDTAGCAHSAAPGGRISATGSTSVLLDDLKLKANSLPVGQVALPFVSPSNQAPMASGDGLLCLSGSLLRLMPGTSGTGGNATFGPGLGQLVGWQAGETWSVQIAFRDTSSPCGQAFNWTSAVALTFQP